jgi:hypothetical protein
MSIKRAKPSAYTAIPNALSQDSRLSFEARGVLQYLLSKPDNWEIQFIDVEREGHIGRDKRIRIFAELERAGYFERVELRAGGRYDYDYVLHDVPINNGPTPHPENPFTVNPLHTEERVTEKNALPEAGKGEALPASSEKPSDKAGRAFFKEMVPVLEEQGEDNVSARKMLGKMLNKYDKHFVFAVFEESRENILEASNPYSYLTKILEVEKGKTPEQRAAEQQLRKAHWFHAALYQNCEFTPAFEPQRYVTRFPLIERFIEKTA